MKTKYITRNRLLGVAACAGAVLLVAAGASAQQNLFVGSYGAHSIVEFPSGGGSPTTFATGTYYPENLAFNSAGNLFASDEFAGNIYKYTGGVQSTFASGISDPWGLAFNSAGNLFVSANTGGTILEYSAGGALLSTFATGLSSPAGIAFDSSGNLYCANNTVVTKITPGGVQSTFASGLSGLNALAFDSSGNLYASTCTGTTAGFITKITPGGTESLFASNLNQPIGLAFNNAGTLFVADGGVNSQNGDITEVAPNGTETVFDTTVGKPISVVFQPVPEPTTLALLGIGVAAFFARRHLRKGYGVVSAVALLLTAFGASAQNLFVSENLSSGIIYEYSPAGVQSTFASTGLNYPYGLAFNTSGDLFVANCINDAGVGGYVTEIAPGGAPQSTIPSGPDPKGLAFDSSGDLFETDYHSGNIYKYTQGGVLSIFATVTPAPQSIAINTAGDLFIGTGYGGGNEDITEITPQGVQTTFATGLSYINGLAFNSAGNLFESDESGNIYEYTPQGVRSTFASGLSNLGNLAFNNQGNLFMADTSGTIYEFAPNGTRSTFASGLNGPVGMAFQPVPEPTTLALLGIGVAAFFARRHLRKGYGVASAVVFLLTAFGASAQNLFVSGSSGNIYQFTPGGAQSTFATPYNGSVYTGLAFDKFGDLFVGDNHNGAIYEFKPGYVAGQTPITFASGLPGATGLVFNSAGNLLVSEGAAGSTIDEYTPAGVHSSFATGLPNVEGLVFDSSGNLYAAGSSFTDVITRITPGGGQSTLPITGLNEPAMLAFNSSGDLFIGNNYGGNVLEYSHTGVQSTLASGLPEPFGLAFNNAGTLFEGDASTPTINQFNGGVQSPFVTGSGTGGLGWMTMQPVPEPSTFGLFGTGLTALLVLRRKYSSGRKANP